MYKKLTVLLILVYGLLVSCDSTSTVEQSVSPGVTEYRLSVTMGSAYEFKLTDGTRCVAIYKGGLDCDWKK